MLDLFEKLFNLTRIEEAISISMSSVEQQMKDFYAKKRRYSQLDFGTHPDVGFWILTDGTMIRVWERWHAETADNAGIDYDELIDAGALRGYSVKKTGEMGVEGYTKPTSAQKSAFLMLSRKHLARTVYIELPGNCWNGPIKNLEYVLEYGAKSLGEAVATKDEKEQFFVDRTNKHIQLVQGAAAKILKAYPEYDTDILRDQLEVHDQSKLEEPERTPYIEITWRHKLENEKGEYDPYNGKGYQTPGKLEKEEENEATLHHITTNSHHPEYHLEDKSDANISNKSDECVDASLMPPSDIVEMIADWQAMAEELQTNTAREWFEKQKDVRWHFTEEQEELIDKLLKVFE